METDRGGGSINCPLVSVVIVTWNSARYIRRTLESVFAQQHLDLEVLVVDNGSDDETATIVAREFPAVQLIRLGTNLGFCGGNNIGFHRACGTYILCLNPDVWLLADHVSRLAECLKTNPLAGMACGKLYATAGLGESHLLEASSHRQLDTTGIVIGRNGRPADRGQGLRDVGQFDDVADVFGACGAAVLYRKTMLDSVAHDMEYFDESFFAYKEDVDLSWRARHAGWKCTFVSTAVGFHVRGWKKGSRRTVSRLTRVNSLRNQYLLLIKNLSFHPWWQVPRVVLHELCVVGYFTIFEPFLWRAVCEAFQLWPEMVRRRRQIMLREDKG